MGNSGNTTDATQKTGAITVAADGSMGSPPLLDSNAASRQGAYYIISALRIVQA